ncbi:hypothetical protein ABL78_4316 [Leptomonas seymouri]|uniref:Uncharacterized protein n=1 Tax=Leptomonas seymouri TaxID=5684 RepID=A0A0N1HWU4_LEPSE|nr:hypothetical protein ABL78_4316 [Leptomonas seymouri]|eukprot:KPI86638.1 hypothetical protein ABL78_4316 [Leptomonas seymouri]
MPQGTSSGLPRRSGSTTTKGAQPFDPAAYAALIAISAARSRLRESLNRGASASTARPSSVHHSPSYEPSPDVHVSDFISPPRVCDSRRVKEIVARYLPQARPTPHADAIASSCTSLQQLAFESESNSSATSGTSEYVVAAAEEGEGQVTPVGLSAGWGASRTLYERSLSPPASVPLPDVRRPLPPSSASASPSPPAGVPAAENRAGVLSDLEAQDHDVAVSLRDASPLRERSVAGTAGISYRISTVEAVHAVVQQLNFALYQ